MKTSGFGTALTERQLRVLQAFNKDGTLVWPAGSNLTEEETKEVLQELRDANLIKGLAPIKLTKLGKQRQEKDKAKK